MFAEMTKNRATPLLFFILGVGLLLRLWGIGFGLPYRYAVPDEGYVIITALNFGTGSANPGTFIYPTLYMYLLFALYGVMFVSGLASGRFASPVDFGVSFLTDPTPFYLTARLLSVAFGAASVYLVYRISLRILGRSAAIVSAFFLSVANLHVRDSHFGTVDVAASFFVLASCLWIIRAYELGRRRDWLVGGLLAGAAAATKYLGVFLLAPAAASAALRKIGKKGKENPVFPVLIFAAGLVIGFFVGSPFAVLDFGRFAHDISLNLANLHLAWGGAELGRGWWYHLRYSLPHGMGWPMYLTGLGGSLLILIKDVRKGLLLLAFPIVYYLTSGRGQAVFVRYMVPVVPFLAMTAGYGVQEVVRGICGVRLRGSLAAAILALAIGMPSLVNAARSDMLLAKTDSRQLAAAWMIGHAGEGESVYSAAPHTLGLPRSKPDIERSIAEKIAGGGRRHTLVARVLQEELTQSRILGTRRFEIWKFDEEKRQFTYGGEKQGTLPEYIVVEDSPLTGYSRASEYILRLVAERYMGIAQFTSHDVEAAGNYYDLQDQFYMPLSGFEGVHRPGPNITVYRKQ